MSGPAQSPILLLGRPNKINTRALEAGAAALWASSGHDTRAVERSEACSLPVAVTVLASRVCGCAGVPGCGCVGVYRFIFG